MRRHRTFTLSGLAQGCAFPVLLTCFVLVENSSAFNESASGDLTNRVNGILDGVTFHRESIQSGQFRCRGTWRHVTGGSSNPDIGDVTIFCAFDITRNLLRFDREQPYQIGVHVNEINSVATKFVRTSDDTKYWRKDYSHMAEVYSPDWAPDFLGKPFDVRILGMAYWGDFVMAARFDKLVEFYRSDPPVEIIDDGESLTRVTWIYGKNRNNKRTMWINRHDGYTPIRLEVCNRYEAVTGTSEWPPPCIVSDVAWNQRDGVWVPSSYQITYAPPRGHGTSTKYELVFDWEAVNKSVDDKLFTTAGLELPSGTVVIDHRLGTPIIVDKLGYPSMSRHSHLSKWKSTRVILIVINVVILLAIGIALRNRYRKRYGLIQ